MTKPEEIEDEDEIIELEDEEQRLEELCSKTKIELKEMAKEYGLTGISKLNKGDLIQEILEAEEEMNIAEEEVNEEELEEE
ncbi:MAG: Rho termination factor N-terminal domain-containing protein [Candidatus Helarchaeota archaeon]|nr:Rho termination factor N-terminal domain-containing protein [Candidatus Helarchaeota archaeon]